MSTELIERFFHSKQGQEFQRELCDENLNDRKRLVKEVDAYKQKMHDLLDDKNCPKLQNVFLTLKNS